MFKKYEQIYPTHTCPMCQEGFVEFDDAMKCIKTHIIPDSIESFGDIEDDGPGTVIIKLSNGKFAEYKFVEILGDE